MKICAKGETIRLEFPNPETKEQYTIAGERYQVTFRGSTVVDIEPRAKGPELIPLYPLSHYWAEKAPIHTVRRFVAEKVLPSSRWWISKINAMGTIRRAAQFQVRKAGAHEGWFITDRASM